jgi:Rieske Fe-S protein
MKKSKWILGILAVIVVIIVLNAATLYATLTYVSQETELEASEYIISGNTLVIDLAAIEDLSEAGGAVTIVDESLPSYILIARIQYNDYRVVSSECPHRGHAIGYIHEDSVFKCSSLGGETFDLDGNYVSGLAEEDLTTYSYTIDDDIMIIYLAAS